LLAQLATLTALYVGVATLVHTVIALLAGSFTRFFADPVWSRRLGRVFAVLLTAVAVWFFFATELKS
jgi:threonine/homoserine/homoserine lactone efflux protein